MTTTRLNFQGQECTVVLRDAVFECRVVNVTLRQDSNWESNSHFSDGYVVPLRVAGRKTMLVEYEVLDQATLDANQSSKIAKAIAESAPTLGKRLIELED